MGRTPSGVVSNKFSVVRGSNTYNKFNRNGQNQGPQNFEQLGKSGASKNDEEVMVEKALIELNEVKNDIIIQKNDEAITEKINKTESKTQLQSMAGGVTATSFKLDRVSLPQDVHDCPAIVDAVPGHIAEMLEEYQQRILRSDVVADEIMPATPYMDPCLKYNKNA